MNRHQQQIKLANLTTNSFKENLQPLAIRNIFENNYRGASPKFNPNDTQKGQSYETFKWVDQMRPRQKTPNSINSKQPHQNVKQLVSDYFDRKNKSLPGMQAKPSKYKQIISLKQKQGIPLQTMTNYNNSDMNKSMTNSFKLPMISTQYQNQINEFTFENLTFSKDQIQQDTQSSLYQHKYSSVMRHSILKKPDITKRSSTIVTSMGFDDSRILSTASQISSMNEEQSGLKKQTKQKKRVRFDSINFEDQNDQREQTPIIKGSKKKTETMALQSINASYDGEFKFYKINDNMRECRTPDFYNQE